MNETRWQTESDALALLTHLYPLSTLGSERPQTRASRLYLLACARRHWDRLPGACRVLVELGERFAEAPRREGTIRTAATPVAEELIRSDGTPADLDGALEQLRAAGLVPAGAHPAAPEPADTRAWRKLAALVYLPLLPTTPPYTWVPAEFHSADLVRETHYNPFRPPLIEERWRTSDVLALAQGMYDSGDFGAMPVLADALQDAGCPDGPVPEHCRGAGTHARGCWALDAVLKRR